MDEQMISVPCEIDGCNARVYAGTRCHEHGGDPMYEWRTSDFGDVTYHVKESDPQEGATSHA